MASTSRSWCVKRDENGSWGLGVLDMRSKPWNGMRKTGAKSNHVSEERQQVVITATCNDNLALEARKANDRLGELDLRPTASITSRQVVSLSPLVLHRDLPSCIVRIKHFMPLLNIVILKNIRRLRIKDSPPQSSSRSLGNQYPTTENPESQAPYYEIG